MKNISAIDLAVIVLYLAGIVGAGVWVGLRKRKGGEAGSYFLAGNTLGWPSIGLALFATNISCLHLVSLAQAGYDSGLLMGNFEWLAAYTLIVLSLFFVPFYMRAKVSTLPDFFEKRYCTECRDWLAGLSMLTAIIFNIAFPLSTGWLVLHGVFGINKWICIVTLTTLTAIYTILGGLSAVVMTETIQAMILLTGSIIITALAYSKAGGWHGMTSQLHSSGETIRLSMLRSSADEPGLPWYAVLLGYPALSIWYWCADQTIVQRVLGAKDENHARTGPLFCGLIKVFPVFVFILPGLLFLTMIEGGKVDGIAQFRVRGEQAVMQSSSSNPASARTNRRRAIWANGNIQLRQRRSAFGPYRDTCQWRQTAYVDYESGCKSTHPAAQCNCDVVEGNVRADDQESYARWFVWCDGGSADGCVDG